MVPKEFLKSKTGPETDARPALSAGLREAGLIAGATVLLALACWASGLDAWVAQRVYHPAAGWGWTLRAWGAWAGGMSAVLALPLCLWAPLGRKAPLLQQSALILVLTAVLGAGLINQVIVKDLASRPRPRDFLLSQQVPTDSRIQPAQLAASTAGGEGLHGKSMPSGHAGMAGVLVAPFFVLRRRKPELALALLAVGTAAGLAVGAARMALGAHFLSDVLVAGGINLAVAAALAPVVARMIDPTSPRAGWRLSGGLAVCLTLGVLAMVLGNKFNLTLTYPLPGGIGQLRGFELPCLRGSGVHLQPEGGVATTEVQLALKGYGAPLSQLALYVGADGRLRLQTHKGLYRGLKCTLTVAEPAAAH